MNQHIDIDRVLADAAGFRQRVAGVWGDAGRQWLERLPARIATCADRWGLLIQAPAPTFSYNFVAFVVTSDGTDAVLKLGVPNPELLTEINALRTFAGRFAVELLAADSQMGALLMRRVVPGTPLAGIGDDEEATEIAARLIRDLPVAEPAAHRFPTLADWALVFDRLRARFDGATGPLPAPMVAKAEQLFEDLHASQSQQMLLHGDLHHENILRDGDDTWVAIDPKGVIGELAYEAARLQHNPIPGFLSMEQPRAVAQRRVEILASVLREDRARLLGWAFVDAILSACWSVEEDADTWRYACSCAELLEAIGA